MSEATPIDTATILIPILATILNCSGSSMDWVCSGIDWECSGIDWDCSGIDWDCSGVDWAGARIGARIGVGAVIYGEKVK